MYRIAAVSAALVLTVLVAPVSHAAPAPKPGDCYAKADIAKDFLDTTSKIDCSKPHAVQVLSVSPLPKELRSLEAPPVAGTKGPAHQAFVKAGLRSCTAQRAAAGIWPKKGKALAAQLGSDVVSFAPAIRASEQGLNWGFVLPDERAWDRGVRSIVCVMHGQGKQWSGDLRSVESSAPLPAVRYCTDVVDGRSKTVSCDQPHENEYFFYWVVKGFPPGETFTAEQWAPYDARCKTMATPLIGADRPDLEILADFGGRTNSEDYGGDLATLLCFARSLEPKPLPPGTVMGLGNRPLGS